MNSSWASVPDSEKLYLETIKSIEQTQSVVVLASALAKRLSANNNELLNSYIVSRYTYKSLLSNKYFPHLGSNIRYVYKNLRQYKNSAFAKCHKGLLPPLVGS